MANTIHVDVVSVTESIYSGEAEFVVLPGVMGELGIYPKHAPLITQIKPGEVRIKVPGQDDELRLARVDRLGDAHDVDVDGVGHYCSVFAFSTASSIAPIM